MDELIKAYKEACKVCYEATEKWDDAKKEQNALFDSWRVAKSVEDEACAALLKAIREG